MCSKKIITKKIWRGHPRKIVSSVLNIRYTDIQETSTSTCCRKSYTQKTILWENYQFLPVSEIKPRSVQTLV